MRYKIPILRIIVTLFVIVQPALAEAKDRKFIYQKKDKEVIFRTCIPGKLKNRTDCAGPSSENRLAADYFTNVLLSPYLIIDSDKLKPLSENEKKAYQADGLDPSVILQKRKANLIYKLGIIENLLLKGRDKKTSLLILKNAKKQLLTSDPSRNDILKLNGLITKIIEDRINDSETHSRVETETTENRTLWRQFDASITECGLDDNLNIDKRIASCATAIKVTRKDKQIRNWALVARQKNDSNGRFYEVWKDTQSGLIWGDLFDKPQPQLFVVDLSEDGKVIKDKLCSSPEYKMAKASISQITFHLPTINELELAIQNGIGDVAPNMNNWYWSSSSFPNEYQDIAWGISNGRSQFRDFDFKYYYSAVRCVSRNTGL